MITPILLGMTIPTFGEWLKERRLSSGLTQEELANAIGSPRTYVIKIEKGEVRLPKDRLRLRIHQALGTSDDELLRLGIMKPRHSPSWVYEVNVSDAGVIKANETRAQVVALINDPRIPDDAIEGVRRVLLGYLDRSE
jgi:transcriptional regulator with XRE-family HTH domain